MLVLNGMNYENKATLYEETMKSLKFMGEGGHAQCDNNKNQHFQQKMKRHSWLQVMQKGVETMVTDEVGTSTTIERCQKFAFRI